MTPPALHVTGMRLKILLNIPVSALRVPSVVREVRRYRPWISSFISITLSDETCRNPVDEYGTNISTSSRNPKRSFAVLFPSDV